VTGAPPGFPETLAEGQLQLVAPLADGIELPNPLPMGSTRLWHPAQAFVACVAMRSLLVMGWACVRAADWCSRRGRIGHMLAKELFAHEVRARSATSHRAWQSR
jgi:hypothetical protein